MTGGRDLGSFLASLQSMNLETISEVAIDNTLDQMKERNIDQLRHGYDSKGNRLPGYKWEEYANTKHAQNALPGFGNPDYILKGGFTGAFVAERSGDLIGIYSLDGKAQKLEERTDDINQDRQKGADLIYGLGEKEHNSYVKEDLEPAFMDEVRRALDQ